MVDVPLDAGVAVAFSETFPVTVELLAGEFQATAGPSAACALLLNARPPPRTRVAMAMAREILMG